MNPTSPNLLAKEIIRSLVAHPGRCLVPTLVLGLIAVVYAIVSPGKWEASQALIIRNEANNNQQVPGKFNHADEMKTEQETILELLRGRSVLEGALPQVGAASGNGVSISAVESLRDTVKLAPPKGAEFGKTEIFYLKLNDHNRDRALALSTAVCEHLQARYQEVRDAKAKSMIEELAKTAQLARADLDESTRRLTEVESKVGSDLPELRCLHEAGNGDSALRRSYIEICAEHRQAETVERANQELLGLLTAAQANPARLLATPSRLLDAHPALRRLKEGLVDAQIRTAQYLGKMGEGHPLGKAAKEAEHEIAQQLKGELEMAVRGLEVESRLNAERLVMLDGQLNKITGRLGQLAEVRAVYANLISETKHREQLLQRAEENLADARAAQASAKASSLISPVDVANVKQIGPGALTIVASGLAGGLLVGLGLIVLSLPTAVTTPQIVTAHPQPATRHGLSLKEALRKVVHGKTL